MKLVFILVTLMPALAAAQNFKVGFSRVDITPYDYEVQKNPGFYKLGQPFWDTGVDRKFDYEEVGALGSDGAPGIVGVDDDNNGKVDDCDRNSCAEYMARLSDDVADPAKDNFDLITNPKGTENDKKFQMVTLGGFQPFYPIPGLEIRAIQGVHDPIWARGIAVTGDNGVTTIMISTDLPGLAWKHMNPARRKLAEIYNIPVENIIMASTHNHAAPDAAGYWVTLLPGKGKDYTDRVRKWLVEAGVRAMNSREAATMKSAMGEPVSCYNSKTGEFKYSKDCNIPKLRREYVPGHNFDEEAIQNDKRDPIVRNMEFTASQFTSVATGQVLGTFLNFHSHPDSSSSDNFLITSEFVHFLRDYVEKKLGGTAVYFSGTVGCQIGIPNWNPKWTEDMKPVLENGRKVPANHERWDRLRGSGYEIGMEIVNALNAQTKLSGNSSVDVDTRQLDVAPTNFLHMIGTHSMWFFDVEEEDSMRFYGWRCKLPRGCVRSDVSKVVIGDLSIMTAPGEIDPVYWLGREESVADYGKKGKHTFKALKGVRENLHTKYTAVLGQAHNYLSYLLHKGDNFGSLNFKHPDHYEEFVTTSKYFGDDLGNLWMVMTNDSYRYNNRKILPNP